MSDPHSLVIPTRFNGPPASANGGWAAGEFTQAALGVPDQQHWPTTEITLRNPPPLQTPIDVRHDAEAWEAEVAGDPPQPIATLRTLDRELSTPDPVSAEAATQAAASFIGLTRHPFPGCFACGPDRADGLRIFPGSVPPTEADPVRCAAPWTPDATIVDSRDPQVASLAATWAALDCPGGWAAGLQDTAMVLGRMTTRVDALPRIGEPHVAVGVSLGQDGRKRFAATALYDSEQRLVGVAEQTWIVIPPENFNAW